VNSTHSRRFVALSKVYPMAGNKEGAAKAAKTNKEKYGENFYKEIGRKSWKNPERSHKTGFALLPPEERAEKGRKGGSRTKADYKTAVSDEEKLLYAEEYDPTLDFPLPVKEERPGASQ
jgi:general stress protein YciG